MLRLKHSVKLADLKPQILLAAFIAEGVYARYLRECILTSVDDSIHGKKSLHPDGNAIDLRTNNLQGNEPNMIVQEIRESLTKDFDVILEKDHIHIEYDPK